MTRKEFELFFLADDEGSFMTQCGTWHLVEKKIVTSQDSENEGNDETSETHMLYKEDKRAHCMREEENQRTKTCAK